MPHVVLCDQPKNLSRFIQFAVAVSPAFDCAVVSGHIQMTYVPCSVEALICLDNLEYFSQAMKMLKMLKMLATPKTRTPKLHSTGSSATLQSAQSAQSAQSSSPSSRCATRCHCNCQYVCQAPRIVPQFRSFQPTWFECVEAVKITNTSQGEQSGRCWCHGEISFRLCS